MQPKRLIVDMVKELLGSGSAVLKVAAVIEPI
jgi:hypothetical protein